MSDTGIGIDAEKHQLIFDAFVQADGSMTRKYGGSGLGLAITKRLVDLMAGEIHVDSELAEGSVFTFTIPVKAVEVCELDDVVPTDSANEQQSKPSILLAEDNIMNQEVAVDMLESMGYSVNVANNGVEAVQMSQQNCYDIILMDCQMPVKDGFEATKDIRQVDTDHRPVIVAVTGNALAGDRERCLESGMDDFLSKPYSYEQLEAMMTKWINSTA